MLTQMTRRKATVVSTTCSIGTALWISAVVLTAPFWSRSIPAAAQDLDLNAIMPCGTPDFAGKQSAADCTSARSLLMQQCTSCHSFVPIVRQQKEESGWDATIASHRERVSSMSDNELNLLAQFMKDHFRPDRPVPNLPQQLIDNDPGFPPA
jgi:hypothetical protein